MLRAVIEIHPFDVDLDRRQRPQRISAGWCAPASDGREGRLWALGARRNRASARTCWSGRWPSAILAARAREQGTKQGFRACYRDVNSALHGRAACETLCGSGDFDGRCRAAGSRGSCCIGRRRRHCKADPFAEHAFEGTSVLGRRPQFELRVTVGLELHQAVVRAIREDQRPRMADE